MRRLLIGCVLVAVAVGLSASPAQAQTKVRKDPVGDAPSFVDITSAKVQNNAKKYALTVRFSEVVHKNTTVAAFIAPRSIEDEAVYFLGSVPVSGGRHDTRLYRFTEEAGEQRVRCGVRARWDDGRRGFVRFVVPQRCFGADAGTLVTFPIALDKQADQGVAIAARRFPAWARSAAQELRRGDAVDPDAVEVEDGDVLDSFVITTRRGR